tara:strand:- start:397 stop:888 length:492 start_codon:yes stop_codon:yes gene_type:complete
LSLLEENQGGAVLLVPLLAFAEACVGIGLFISGAFLVVVSSILFFTEMASLPIICALAMVGAAAGDHVGFYVGYFLGPRLTRSRFAERHQAPIARANALITKYGPLTIFIGRFVPAIRSLLPAMIGVSGFSRRVYSLLDVLACSLWAVALGAIVYFIGDAFQA